MSHPRFEALREKLLRAGIAPRHVCRYLGELRQHYDDLLSEEKSAGVIGTAAEQAACARLGNGDELAAAMLNQPELRSISARYPWAVFGIAPLLTLGVALFLAVLVEGGFMKLHMLMQGSDGVGATAPGWMKSAVAAWNFSMMYVFPLLVAAAFCFIGARQRVKIGWMALGTFAALLVGAAVSCSVVWSNVPHQSELSVGLGMSLDTASPERSRLFVNLCLAAFMVASQWWFTRRRESAIAD